MLRRTLSSLLLLLLTGLAQGHGARQGELYIAHPHAHPGGPGDLPVHIAALRNGEPRAERLIAARSPRGAISLQRRDAEQRYVDVDAIPLPNGERMGLRAGAEYRLLLRGLDRAVQAGDRLPLTLVFEQAGAVDTVIHVDLPKSNQP